MKFQFSGLKPIIEKYSGYSPVIEDARAESKVDAFSLHSFKTASFLRNAFPLDVGFQYINRYITSLKNSNECVTDRHLAILKRSCSQFTESQYPKFFNLIQASTLDFGFLDKVASVIKSQSDFDEVMMEEGLNSEEFCHQMARSYIISKVNGAFHRTLINDDLFQQDKHLIAWQNFKKDTIMSLGDSLQKFAVEDDVPASESIEEIPSLINFTASTETVVFGADSPQYQVFLKMGEIDWLNYKATLDSKGVSISFEPTFDVYVAQSKKRKASKTGMYEYILGYIPTEEGLVDLYYDPSSRLVMSLQYDVASPTKEKTIVPLAEFNPDIYGNMGKKFINIVEDYEPKIGNILSEATSVEESQQFGEQLIPSSNTPLEVETQIKNQIDTTLDIMNSSATQLEVAINNLQLIERTLVNYMEVSKEKPKVLEQLTDLFRGVEDVGQSYSIIFKVTSGLLAQSPVIHLVVQKAEQSVDLKDLPLIEEDVLKIIELLTIYNELLQNSLNEIDPVFIEMAKGEAYLNQLSKMSKKQADFGLEGFWSWINETLTYLNNVEEASFYSRENLIETWAEIQKILVRY